MKIKIPSDKFTLSGSRRYTIKSRFASQILRVDFVRSSLAHNCPLFYVRASSNKLGTRYLSDQGFQTMEDALKATTIGLTVADNAETIVEELVRFGLVESLDPVENGDNEADVCEFDGAQVNISITSSAGRSEMTMMIYNNSAIAAIRGGRDAEPSVMRGSANDGLKAMAQAFLRVI